MYGPAHSRGDLTSRRSHLGAEDIYLADERAHPKSAPCGPPAETSSWPAIEYPSSRCTCHIRKEVLSTCRETAP